MSEQKKLKIEILKSFIFIVTIVLLSIKGCSAISSEKWEDGMIASKEVGYILFIKKDNISGLKYLYLEETGSKCTICTSLGQGTTSKDTDSWIINNKKVQMLQQCLHNGYAVYFPKTLDGQEYLIKELKIKSRVIFKKSKSNKNIIFSSTGFKEAYDKFEDHRGGL